MQKVTCLALALALAGCGGDNGDDAPTCPGISSPVVLELADVTPAAGTSVPNDAIIHTFTLKGGVAFDSIAFSFPSAHTAGDPTPDLTLTYQVTTEGTVYTAAPLSWETAPGHVEIVSPVVYQTADGCGYQLPSPLFSYDITAP